MASHVTVKCALEGTSEVLRLRLAAPLRWGALRPALAGAFGPRAGASYEDEEGDWCTLAENTFEDFLAVRHQELTAQSPVVKLRVSSSSGQADAAFGGCARADTLPIPDGLPLGPADACGPKPFLAALQQLSHGCVDGWTASNVCTLMLAFMPTLEQRALRKEQKMNKMGSAILDASRASLEELHAQLGQQPTLSDLAQFLR